MNDLYLKTALEQAEQVTRAYSTSFSRAIDLASPRVRQAMYALYGMVRIADEIVDTDWPHIDPKATLDAFEHDVERAIVERYSSNLILHAFQWVFHTYSLDKAQVKAFFESMRLDTAPQLYTFDLYKKYIYGSAEVIGLMALQIFCNGDQALEHELTEGAKALGAAFQKINFLRDIEADVVERGRIYFPGVSSLPLSFEQKKLIEQDIEQDFIKASGYVSSLPSEARPAVQLAFWSYEKLFKKIKKLPPEKLANRQSVSPLTKIILYYRAKFLA